MPDLQTLQNAMTAAILGGSTAFVSEELNAGQASALLRFGIFRNNSYMSLTECLKTVFPVTVRLSDERFFSYVAQEFITRQPPGEARLSSYGAEFPRFLAQFPPCRNFPIIAEMAALEWAIAGSLNDAEEEAAPISLITDASANGADMGLCLQPNLRFAVARWPLLGVWENHLKHHVVMTGPLRRELSRMAIFRYGQNIQMMELEASRFAFWRALAHGRTIEAATLRALARDPLFDLVQETISLFQLRLITGIVTPVTEGNLQ